MSEVKRLYKNIIGDAKSTIDAIQRYIEENSKTNVVKNIEIEEAPAESINRVLNSTICEETNAEIQEIIKKL